MFSFGHCPNCKLLPRGCPNSPELIHLFETPKTLMTNKFYGWNYKWWLEQPKKQFTVQYIGVSENLDFLIDQNSKKMWAGASPPLFQAMPEKKNIFSGTLPYIWPIKTQPPQKGKHNHPWRGSRPNCVGARGASADPASVPLQVQVHNCFDFRRRAWAVGFSQGYSQVVNILLAILPILFVACFPFFS